MSLYTEASLIMYPSGTKDSKIYSLKPVPVYGPELVVNGDFATDSDWGYDANWSIANGKATSTGSGRMLQSIPYLSANVGTRIIVTFDIVDYTSAGVEAACYGVVSEVLSGIGTYSFIGTTTNTTNLYFNNSGQGNLVGAIDNVSVKEVFANGDLDFSRSTTKTYIDANGLIAEAPINVMPVSYEGGGCGKFNFEPQRTNLCNYSEDHTQTNKEACTTSGGILAPDGSMNAWKIVEDTTVDQHVCITDNPTNFSAGEVGTCSIYVKAAERTSARIWFHHITTNQYAFVEYNLITGAFIQSGGTNAVFVDSTIVDMNDGWWRVSITGYKNVSTYSWSPAVSPLDSNGDVTYLGDGVSGVYMWGGQSERGATEASSYIPTAGTAVTRNADGSSTTGLGSLINSEEGVLFMEGTFGGGSFKFITLNSGSSINRVAIYSSGAGSISFNVKNASGNQFNGNITGIDATINHKIALKYKANDFAFWIDGVEKFSQQSGSTFAASTLTDLSLHDGGGGFEFFGYMKPIVVFPTSLTDTQLAELTTI
jgi:hypothetical protein